MSSFFAFGLGLASVNNKNEILETFFAKPLTGQNCNDAEALLASITHSGIQAKGNSTVLLTTEQAQSLSASLSDADSEQATIAKVLSESTHKQAVLVLLASDAEPASVPEAYLKLHLLSHRLVKPHSINLTGIFSCLPNVAWTSEGPVDLNELNRKQLEARKEGRWLSVKSVDKFPQMTDYVVPEGVRIADTSRVRLGAYVGNGTTIMHEGFINFNAGTEGTSMIEGRISAGVVVGEGSDLGGGCSTMGTLSGGGNVVIAVGKNCLIGANAGIGIGLGDNCIVEAGLYITAGSKVAVLDENNQTISTVKARELSGHSDLLFRRNSSTGSIECKTNKTAVELNEALHANN